MRSPLQTTVKRRRLLSYPLTLELEIISNTGKARDYEEYYDIELSKLDPR